MDQDDKERINKLKICKRSLSMRLSEKKRNNTKAVVMVGLISQVNVTIDTMVEVAEEMMMEIAVDMIDMMMEIAVDMIDTREGILKDEEIMTARFNIDHNRRN
ncbi:hypothetical protein GOP47_0030422 [Adiantum capillus-veneris]|nr:hypothetical protein GOP47_0030422 [Adiantum capillus-veneris]